MEKKKPDEKKIQLLLLIDVAKRVSFYLFG